ncbi:MAG: tyrosine protein phosphatase [Legionella sp.]|nr:tyrosine protein phosphatase [Legionella sp.]
MIVSGCRFVPQSFFFLSLLYATIVFSGQEAAICDGTDKLPCIVQDTSASYSHVKNLRDTSMIASYYHEDTAGIDKLWSSASAAPNEDGWQEIADYINKQSLKKPSRIVVVDLRQETHGYLNGQAINLTTSHNWINLGKKRQQVYADELAWLRDLQEKDHINGVLTPKQFDAKKYTHGKNVVIKTVKSEEEVVTEAGLGYHRLNVSDHRAPLDSEVDDFVEFYKKLPPYTWLHIHCRGGKGRSTSFLAMIDMLNNADKVSFHDIIARQASIPPFYNLSEIYRLDPELTDFYEERLVFLTNFYLYAQQIIAGYKGSWSDWKSLQGLVI